MAVNYVKGQILSSILERDGLDISIANANVGINTTSPTVALDVFGNIQANNFNTTGSANTGNITGANVISSVTLCAFGNINGGNLNISANVATGNLLTDNLLYANGTPWDLQQPAGSNTQIQSNNNNNFGASDNFTFDTTANLLVVNATANIANINVAGNASAVGNITGGNLLTNGNVSAAGNITGNYFFGTFVGNISGNLTVPGANTQVIYNNNGNAGASSGFTFDQTSNAIVVEGNVTGGNILTGGLATITGNVTTSGQLISTKAGSATTGEGQLYLNGATNNRIDFNTNGVAAPTANTRSTGTKVVLYPALGASAVDYALGINSGVFWSSVPGYDDGQFFKWYGNTTEIASLSGTGVFSVAGNITGANINISGGNISGANVIFGNTVSATGNSYANIFVGNTAIIGTGSVTGNILAGNILIPAVGNISAGNVNINNLSNPVANQDAATKYYVDQSISNIAVTNQTLYGNNVATTFTLDRSTTTAAVLVILNGITQVPDQSYSMSPSPSVNLVFTEAPETGDVIDIRFL